MIKVIPEYNQQRQRRCANPNGYFAYEKAIELSCGILWSFHLAPTALHNFVELL